jgi:hypothetical protein
MARAVDLELELRDVSPRVWRRVRVTVNLTLADLHRVIQVLMSWGDYHLHVFEVGEREYSPQPEDLDDDDPPGRWAGDDADLTIARALADAGGRLQYVYDFGDDWRLSIESVGDAVATLPFPECLAGELAGPPEDSGGPRAHQQLLDMWRAKGRRGLDPELREWLPPDFDALRFDVEAANLRLQESFAGAPADAGSASSPDEQLLQDLTLLLLRLGSWQERSGAWVADKTMRVDVLEALSGAGYLRTNPHRKSVVLSDLGVRRAEALRARVAALLDVRSRR